MHLDLTHVPMCFVRPSPLHARAPFAVEHASAPALGACFLGFGAVGACVGRCAIGATCLLGFGVVGAGVSRCAFVGRCFDAMVVVGPGCLAVAAIAAGVRSSQHRFPCALYE